MDQPKDSPGADDDHTETVRARYDWSVTAPSTGVLETVASAVGRDPTDLPSLFEVVDPDALDTLVCSDERSAGETTVSLTFADSHVTVRSTGEVVVDLVTFGE